MHTEEHGAALESGDAQRPELYQQHEGEKRDADVNEDAGTSSGEREEDGHLQGVSLVLLVASLTLAVFVVTCYRKESMLL